MDRIDRIDRIDLTAADIVHDVALEVLEDDPYPTYAWMRRHRPIAFVPETGRVWVTTWDLCDEAGRNDKVFGPTSDVFHAVYGNPNVMSLSGPEHLAHRAALNACFRPRAVNGYREQILRATAVRYIDAIRDRGQADANTEILERISMRAIGDVLGFTDVHDDILIRPEQAARLRADPSAWSAAAVEEGLRWLAPFGMTEKLTTADVTLGGILFPVGTEVAMVLGSANRDATRYADPDVFDLDRPRQSHASFGYGLHFCLGHFVARQLEQVMLEEMFARLPNLRPDPDQEATVHGWAVRAAKRLPVVWDA